MVEITTFIKINLTHFKPMTLPLLKANYNVIFTENN